MLYYFAALICLIVGVLIMSNSKELWTFKMKGQAVIDLLFALIFIAAAFRLLAE